MQGILGLIQLDFTRAYQIAIDYQAAPIPEFLTPQKVLEIRVEMFKQCLLGTAKLLQENGVDMEAMQADFMLHLKNERMQRDIK